MGVIRKLVAHDEDLWVYFLIVNLIPVIFIPQPFLNYPLPIKPWLKVQTYFKDKEYRQV